MESAEKALNMRPDFQTTLSKLTKKLEKQKDDRRHRHDPPMYDHELSSTQGGLYDQR
jgi:hypothetical protein